MIVEAMQGYSWLFFFDGTYFFCKMQGGEVCSGTMGAQDMLATPWATASKGQVHIWARVLGDFFEQVFACLLVWLARTNCPAHLPHILLDATYKAAMLAERTDDRQSTYGK